MYLIRYNRTNEKIINQLFGSNKKHLGEKEVFLSDTDSYEYCECLIGKAKVLSV